MDNFFSKNLLYLRTCEELSYVDMAENLGIGKSTLEAYEKGRSEPTLSVIMNIIRYFGISFSVITEVDLAEEKIPLVAEPTESYGGEVAKLKIQIETLKEALREIGKGINQKNL